MCSGIVTVPPCILAVKLAFGILTRIADSSLEANLGLPPLFLTTGGIPAWSPAKNLRFCWTFIISLFGLDTRGITSTSFSWDPVTLGMGMSTISARGVPSIGFVTSVEVNILSEEVTSVLIRFSFTTSTASTVGSL